MNRKILALSGGVGGAKLCLGLKLLVDKGALAGRLQIIANTGDDFEHHGLYVCPDLDTVMYTLSGTVNTELGWGRGDESFNCLAALEQLGGESWFRLGDRDLATHVVRSERLGAGQSLSRVTTDLCSALGLSVDVAPMTDDPVYTKVRTQDGELHFQHYFVRDRCQPTVTGFRFDGLERAQPSAALRHGLEDQHLAAILVCPSNPMVSVDPILELPGVAELITASPAPMIAVSPIIGGRAVKGPAAKMLEELDMPVSALGVAEHYAGRGLLDGMVIDHEDAALEADIGALGIAVLVTQTMMVSLEDREKLAKECLDFVSSIRG